MRPVCGEDGALCFRCARNRQMLLAVRILETQRHGIDLGRFRRMWFRRTGELLPLQYVIGNVSLLGFLATMERRGVICLDLTDEGAVVLSLHHNYVRWLARHRAWTCHG